MREGGNYPVVGVSGQMISTVRAAEKGKIKIEEDESKINQRGKGWGGTAKRKENQRSVKGVIG